MKKKIKELLMKDTRITIGVLVFLFISIIVMGAKYIPREDSIIGVYNNDGSTITIGKTTVAPSGSFNPSDVENGVIVKASGKMLKSGTLQVNELEFSSSENTALTCEDGKDNDFDGYSDCFDSECTDFCCKPEDKTFETTIYSKWTLGSDSPVAQQFMLSEDADVTGVSFYVNNYLQTSGFGAPDPAAVMYSEIRTDAPGSFMKDQDNALTYGYSEPTTSRGWVTVWFDSPAHVYANTLYTIYHSWESNFGELVYASTDLADYPGTGWIWNGAKWDGGNGYDFAYQIHYLTVCQ